VNDVLIMHIAVSTMILATKLAAPILLTSLVLGFGVSVMQSVTQIQEVTLSFVPKLVGVGVVILVSGHWMLNQIIDFTHSLFEALPQLLGG
jgi:flagellar biosynthetic protein FliQ